MKVSKSKISEARNVPVTVAYLRVLNAHWFTYLCQLQEVFSMEHALLSWVLHVNNDKKSIKL